MATARARIKLIEVTPRTPAHSRRKWSTWGRPALSQVAAEGGAGDCVDLLGIAPISGVTVLQGDFRQAEVQAQVAAALGGRKADVVLSDLSPNISGIAPADQARAAELVRTAADFCRAQLQPQGALLVKVFQGEEFAGLLQEMKQLFREVKTLKPAASRGESRETYLLARGLKGYN